jgi:ADP-ribose pyrophosphatase
MTEPILPKSVYPDHPLASVGAVVFKDNRVLLVQRGRPPAQGQWAIPGGRIALGETMQQAAEREILEETSIVIAAHEPIYTFDVLERDPRNQVRFHYVVVDLIADYIRGEPHPGDDAADARWVAAEELARMDINPRTRMLLHRVFQFGKG